MADLSKIKLNGAVYNLKDSAVPAWAKAASAPVTSVNGQTGAVNLIIPTTYDDTALAARVTALEAIPWVTYYTGANAPSNSQGSNGDLYLQTESQ